jgi:hypothetical protein
MRVCDERRNEGINCKPERYQACLVSDKHQQAAAELDDDGKGGEDYAAGLMYAEDSGWLEVSPSRDMLTLTAVGFAKI